MAYKKSLIGILLFLILVILIFWGAINIIDTLNDMREFCESNGGHYSSTGSISFLGAVCYIAEDKSQSYQTFEIRETKGGYILVK